MRKLFLVLALALGFAIPSFAQQQIIVPVIDPNNFILFQDRALSSFPTSANQFIIPLPGNATTLNLSFSPTAHNDNIQFFISCTPDNAAPESLLGFPLTAYTRSLTFFAQWSSTPLAGNSGFFLTSTSLTLQNSFSTTVVAGVQGCGQVLVSFGTPGGTTTDLLSVRGNVQFGNVPTYTGVPLATVMGPDPSTGNLNPGKVTSSGQAVVGGPVANNTSASGVNPVLVAGLDAVSGNVVRSIGVGSNGAIYLGQVLAGFSPASQGGIFPVNQAGTFAPLMVATGYQYGHITTTNATPLGTSNGRLFHTLNIGTGAAGTVKVFDLANASCTGTPGTNIVATITATATTTQTYTFDATMTNGLCVQASVAMDLTVTYQ